MQQMMGVRSVGNADIDFAALMSIHHQGAVDMANTLLKTGSDEELKKMAKQIIIDQKKEIAVFGDVLNSLKVKSGNDSGFFKKSMQDMHHMQLMDDSSFIERQIVLMMIPHHEGAINMAKTYLQIGAKNSELKKIANNIIKSQQVEIDRFKHLLTDMKP